MSSFVSATTNNKSYPLKSIKMKLSERLEWNAADRHILDCAGFPLERIDELDNTFQQINESLVISICTLAEPILLEQPDYSTIILPKELVMQFKDDIDQQFSGVSSSARQTLWSFASQYLWNSCHNALSAIKHEKRFNDPELGDFFRALEDAKKSGFSFERTLLNK
ncbi:MAG: hypothetical protein A2546_07115 [Sphingobacteriia bacterium RIFOXYD2_FULL_35_12]|nr:MAG: hypothetical protein A2546_07115 [Sphingobacteriia bacterium RIFOXYD2_FULL_35_12]